MSTPEPSDSALLQEIGTGVLRSFISVVVETWLVAIYTVLVIKASSVLLHKKRRYSRVAQATLAVVLVLYILDMCLWIIDVRNVVTELDFTLISRSTDTLDDKHSRSGKSQLRLALVEDVLYAYMVLLGDAIMFWRVYAFWHVGKERFMLILPCIVFTATLALTCLITFCASNSDANLQFGAFTHPPFCRNIQSASYWFQFCTAGVATTLIGLKTWKYRQMIKPMLGSDLRSSPVHRIMTILVDSGIFYMLFFASEAILSVGNLNDAVSAHPSLSFALEIYQYQTSSIVGIYPTIVVILVHSQFALIDQYGNTAGSTTLQLSSGQRSKRSGITVTTRTVAWTDGANTANGNGTRSKQSDKHDLEVDLHEMHLVNSSATASHVEDDMDDKTPQLLHAV